MTGPSASARAFRPASGAQYKLIYLARRHPAMATDDFPAAWRDHSALASTFAASLGSHFRSVRQCVKDRADDLPATFANAYDGSAILAMRSWADLLAARYHPHALDALASDEKRVFAGAVDDWTMAVEEHVLREGAPQDHVILSFLAPEPSLDPAAFASRSREHAQALAADAGATSRIVCNRVIDTAREYPFAAVTEWWHPSRDAMLGAARAPGFAQQLEQRGIADADRSVHLFARLNLAKAATGAAGATRWSDPR